MSDDYARDMTPLPSTTETDFGRYGPDRMRIATLEAQLTAKTEECAGLRKSVDWVYRKAGIDLSMGFDRVQGALHVAFGGNDQLNTLAPLWDKQQAGYKSTIAEKDRRIAELENRKTREMTDLIGILHERDAELAEVRAEGEKMRAACEAALAYLELMTTCHQCQASLSEDHCPPHCEDCSYDCEVHDGEPCDPDASYQKTWTILRKTLARR